MQGILVSAMMLSFAAATFAAPPVDGVVTKAEGGKISIKVGNQTRTYNLANPKLVIRPAKSTLEVGDKVQIDVGTDKTFISKPAANAQPAPEKKKVPTVEEVKDVLRMDDRTRLRFDLESDETRKLILLAAQELKTQGRPAGLGETRPVIVAVVVVEHASYFPKDTVDGAMDRLVEMRQLDRLFEAMKIAKEERRAVIFAAAGVTKGVTDRAIKIAEQIAKEGRASLSDDDRDFIREHPRLFGL